MTRTYNTSLGSQASPATAGAPTVPAQQGSTDKKSTAAPAAHLIVATKPVATDSHPTHGSRRIKKKR
jgi:hypothetical protein